MQRYAELAPPPRTLMGPGPVDVDPRVLRAMSMPMLGQFDPAFTQYMNEVMSLYRGVFRTKNPWPLLVDGTARAGIEAALVSLIEPGDRVLVPIFGRFGHLQAEIAGRCRAEVITLETSWGEVFPPERIEAALIAHRPKLLLTVQGDTSTTMAQPLDDLGELCRRHGTVLYVDATATVGGMPLEVDEWGIDIVSAGLQKCLSGPPGVAPLTFNNDVADRIRRRQHVEAGIRTPDTTDGPGSKIQSNYFDIAMLMDYWSEARLNHHTEATSMLYAAHECARIVLEEGLEARFTRHELASRAMVAGLTAMGLELFGDLDHKMPNVTGVVIPPGVNGDGVRAALLDSFALEIGTSFGPLDGKIWRIGTMGYGCRRDNVLGCLAALEATLRRFGFKPPPRAGVAAAWDIYEQS